MKRVFANTLDFAVKSTDMQTDPLFIADPFTRIVLVSDPDNVEKIGLHSPPR